MTSFRANHHDRVLISRHDDEIITSPKPRRPRNSTPLKPTPCKNKATAGGQADKPNGVKPKGRKNFVSVKPKGRKNISVLDS